MVLGGLCVDAKPEGADYFNGCLWFRKYIHIEVLDGIGTSCICIYSHSKVGRGGRWHPEACALLCVAHSGNFPSCKFLQWRLK